MYLLIRYYLKDSSWFHGDGWSPERKTFGPKKILLIVPTINLVHQMYSDFKDYGWDVENMIHLIYEGQEKTSPKPLWISTWQSIYDMPKEYYNFDVILCDEVHHAQADSIKGIMEAADKTDIRVGCTGTLSNTLTHRLVLEGLFGEVYEATTTKELIEQKHLAELKIKCIVLKHLSKPKVYEYSDEIEYLAENEARNRFIQNLALSLYGNTMILFRLVDKHGKGLYNRIKNATDRPTYLIHVVLMGLLVRELIFHPFETLSLRVHISPESEYFSLLEGDSVWRKAKQSVQCLTSLMILRRGISQTQRFDTSMKG